MLIFANYNGERNCQHWLFKPVVLLLADYVSPDSRVSLSTNPPAHFPARFRSTSCGRKPVPEGGSPGRQGNTAWSSAASWFLILCNERPKPTWFHIPMLWSKLILPKNAKYFPQGWALLEHMGKGIVCALASTDLSAIKMPVQSSMKRGEHKLSCKGSVTGPLSAWSFLATN